MKAIIEKIAKETNFKKWFFNIKVQIFLCSIITFIVLHATFSISVFNFEYDYKLGDIVKTDIVINENYFDDKETEKLKEKAKYEVEKIYTIEAKVYADAKQKISEFYNKAYDIRLEYKNDIDTLNKVFPYLLKDEFRLQPEELIYLAQMDELDLRLTENYVYDSLREILRSGVTEENIIKNKQNVIKYFENLEQMDDIVKPIIIKIVDYSIIINSFLDEEATAIAIDEHMRKVDDIVINSGTTLIESGDMMDVKTLSIINSLNMNNLHTFKQTLPLLNMDIFVLLVLLLMDYVLLFIYKRRNTYKKGVNFDKRVKSKFIILNFVIFNFGYLISFASMQLSLFLIPIASVAMLISVLEDAYVGVLYSVFLTLIFSVVFYIPTEIVVIMILGCIVSSIFVYKVHQRGKIFIAGLIISVINSVSIMSISAVQTLTFSVSFENVLYGALAGVLCSVITIGSLPIWEAVFRILTPLKLLELADPNHPILKKMLLEAPGTYHHSILVGNLSEAAAHDIGANSLLARVGAYFHDIGKIDRPFLYAENQYDGNNPHDQLVPRVSAKIIKDHVEKGITLGNKYKLPNEIIEFIEQHHGTTMVQYFYHKAKDASNLETEISKDAYTYLGPIPCKKEIAIVMLADSVEAAVRSVKNADKQSIKDLINKIIDSKIKAHQLENSDLTLKDIDVISKSFISNLSSAFHDRIEYPEIEESKQNFGIVK